MKVRLCWATLFVFLIACAPNNGSPLFLTILQPKDGDTVHTDSVPIEGVTTVGATVNVSETETDTGIFLRLMIRVISRDTFRFLKIRPIPML